MRKLNINYANVIKDREDALGKPLDTSMGILKLLLNYRLTS